MGLRAKYVNETLKHLKGPSDEVVKASLMKLDAIDRIQKIKGEGWPDEWMPTDEEIKENLMEFSPLTRIHKIKRYKLSEKFMPSDREIIDSFPNGLDRGFYDEMYKETTYYSPGFGNVKILLRLGANVNGYKKFNLRSPLLYAASEGRPGVIEFLINAGIDTDIVGTNGKTPVQTAYQGGNYKSVDMLKKYKVK